MKIFDDGLSLHFCGPDGPERIKRRRILVSGSFVGDEIVVEEEASISIPKVFHHALLSFRGFRSPVSSLLRMTEENAHAFQILFCLKEQAVQTNRGIVMGFSAEGSKPKRHVETRLAHASVTLIEISSQGHPIRRGAVGLPRASRFRIADKDRKARAGGSGGGAFIRIADQIGLVRAALNQEKVSYAAVIVARIAHDFRDRAISTIEITREACVARQMWLPIPLLVVADGKWIGLFKPRKILFSRGLFCFINSHDHGTEKRRLRAGQVIGSICIQNPAIVLDLEKEILNHSFSQLRAMIAKQ